MQNSTLTCEHERLVVGDTSVSFWKLWLCIIRPHHSNSVWPIATDRVAWSVCWSHSWAMQKQRNLSRRNCMGGWLGWAQGTKY